MIKKINPVFFQTSNVTPPKKNVSILTIPANECPYAYYTQAQLEETISGIDQEIKLTQITIKQLKKQLTKEDDDLVGYIENKRKATEFLKIAKNKIDK